MYKLAIFTSHPIQYQGPFFAAIAKSGIIEPFVYFGKEKEEYDEEFGRNVIWDIPILDGYRYEFLKHPLSLPLLLLRNSVKYDAILVFGWNSFGHFLVFLAAFFSKTQVMLRGENPLNQELLKPNNLKFKIKKLLFLLLFKRISGFLYIGEENKKFYEYYGVPKEKLFFAPYAVDNERFIKAAQDLRLKIKDLREDLGIKENDVVILFVGKLIEKKRPFDLLRAYELLNMGKSDISNIDVNVRGSEFQKLHLVFVGDGMLRSALEKYTKKHNLKNVRFVGFKNQTEIGEYYALADIFVLPSGAGETWGLVVNEAMCFSLPIIVSDIVGCGSDLVRNGENGYVFPVGGVSALAKNLHTLLNEPIKREKFSKESLKLVGEYSYEQDVKAIIKFFKTYGYAK